MSNELIHCNKLLDIANARLAEREEELGAICTLLGCHRAHILETIRDLQSRTEDIPQIDYVRQLGMEVTRLKNLLNIVYSTKGIPS